VALLATGRVSLVAAGLCHSPVRLVRVAMSVFSAHGCDERVGGDARAYFIWTSCLNLGASSAATRREAFTGVDWEDMFDMQPSLCVLQPALLTLYWAATAFSIGGLLLSSTNARTRCDDSLNFYSGPALLPFSG